MIKHAKDMTELKSDIAGAMIANWGSSVNQFVDLRDKICEEVELYVYDKSADAYNNGHTDGYNQALMEHGLGKN